VAIETTDGRYKAGAKLTLDAPAVLDAWTRSSAYVAGKEVSLCVAASDGWLCAARLPQDLDDDAFQQLAEAYGAVKQAFVVISERTGKTSRY